jgi:hypothetical protein
MYRSFKIQTFQLTSNDSTSIIENVTFLELCLYCSNPYRNIVVKCRCIVGATVTPGCYNSPLVKKSHPKIYEGREVHENRKGGHMDHFFGLSGMKVGLITFLIPRSGSCLLTMRTCRQKQASVCGQH